ncbi:hypothetical protein I302_107325 [Kwoniella bestiolae CBS 10118]|uniref:Methyltransferase type 11 domain-containing protein n=1 Tax=Kwoniella bestiolae CBS 10118 TaxID=1296100 RepID=A0AAJ8KDI2_9TREE
MSPSPISMSSIDTYSETSVIGGRSLKWRDRVIHKIGKNGGWPIDMVEQEHHLLRLYPYHGPVLDILNNPSKPSKKRVLDIGTMGDGYGGSVSSGGYHAEPSLSLLVPAEFRSYRVDEIGIQPELVPPNCESDLSRPLPYHPSSFDIIHIRFLSTRINSYTSLLSQSLSLLRPGGLLILFENFTFSPPQTVHDVIPKAVQAFYDAWKRSLVQSGIEVASLDEIINTLREEGVREIKGDLIKVPVGHGSGRMNQLSKIHLINLKAWIDSTRYTIVAGGGYTDNEFDILSEAFIDALGKEELYTCYHSLWVRKPFSVS